MTMPIYRNLSEVEAVLFEHIPEASRTLGRDITLQRMQGMMRALGNPEDKLRIIHIAGTSGKTSTAYYVAAMLAASGKRIGLTVSPHIDSVAERVQVNSKPLAEAEFCEVFGRFMDIIKDIKPEPTYFEMLIAFAYWYYAQNGMDYVVAETGLGGLHDSTNIANRSDKICVITDIGYDHQAVLGNTLPEIAAQKAGIIHQGNAVVIYRQAPEVMAVFEAKAEEQQADLRVVEQSDLQARFSPDGLSGLPLYQQRNWLLARAVVELTGERDNLKFDPGQLARTMLVQVPGRMDEVKVNGKTLVMDGAHNEQKMRAFTESFKQQFPNQKAVVLLSMKKGKEYETVLPLLKPICSHLIVTSFKERQEFQPIAGDAEILAAAARQQGITDVEVIPSTKQAYQKLMDFSAPLAVITGSLYLLAAVRPFLANNLQNRGNLLKFPGSQKDMGQ